MKNTLVKLIDEISQDVRLALSDDLVSRGELQQIVRDVSADEVDVHMLIGKVIAHLLESDVEIGYALNVDNKYVKFVAWAGSVAERIERACRETESATPDNQEFVFWLCLSSNVDEFEES